MNNTKRFTSLFLSGLVASGITVSAYAETPVNTTNKEENEVVETIDNSVTNYTVKKGDTLYNICTVFYGDGSLWPKVAKYNNISNVRLLQIGQVILLPNDKKLLEEKTQTTIETLGSEYIIKSGDTLTGICEKYYKDGTNLAAWKLATYNGLSNPNKIYVGQKLTMPDYETLKNVVSNDYNWCYVPQYPHDPWYEFKPDIKPDYDPGFKPDIKPDGPELILK